MIESIVPEAVNSEPNFENRGDWSEGYELAKRADGGVAVGPGTVNPNVFAQSFPVGSHKYFRVTARARSISGPHGKANMQINWSTRDGKFIEVSQQAFQINDKELTVGEHRFKVPADAETGTIYVTPGDPDSVVCYDEMSLYPDEGPNHDQALELNGTRNPNFMHSSSKKTRWNSYINDLHEMDTCRPSGFWDRFKRDVPLCFVHIPKTAGHSIYSALYENYPEDTRLIPYHGVEGNIRALLDLLPEEVERTRIVAGHMPFGAHHYVEECNYMTFLRNPLELVISGYYFNMENADAPHHGDAVCSNNTLLQFAECNDNVMTRFLIDCAFFDATVWLSEETKPNIKNKAYLGLDCGKETAVQTVALQQWNAPVHHTRYPEPGVVGKVAVECSNDNFQDDIRVADEIQLEQSRRLWAYSLSRKMKGRFWRIRALEDPHTARWGVVALKFFDREAGALSSLDYGNSAIQGTPMSSGEVDGYPALYAFDGRDRLAQHQVSPNSLEVYHLEEAINNLREYSLVGMVEKFDQSINMIGRALGWRPVETGRRNASRVARNQDILSDYEKKQIAEINRYDLALYQYAQKLFLSDLTTHGMGNR